MSAATQSSSNGRLFEPRDLDELPGQGRRGTDCLEFARAFAETVVVYLAKVMPVVRDELSSWEARANAIPARELRDVALSGMQKRGNIEGAALFATLAPVEYRSVAARALVAFQTAYNYLDALSEEVSADPGANAEQLHQALLCALQPGGEDVDYYALYRGGDDDGGFLTDLVQKCREAVGQLPSFGTVAPLAREAAGRIVDFQALNLAEADGGHSGLEGWSREATPEGSGLSWWETAAGAGSSLAVHALIAGAARPDLDVGGARKIGEAYFPWGGALHSLLDSLVDRREDEARGQQSLLDYYAGRGEATARLGTLAEQARKETGCLPDEDRHRVILTAMCSYYLSAPECETPEARAIRRSLTHVLGLSLKVATWMFRGKRFLHDRLGTPFF